MKTIQFILFLFLSTAILGQQIQDNKRFIEVTGKAVLEISPDEIYLDVSLTESIKNGIKTTLDELESCLQEELEAVGVPKENLFIADINSVIAKTGWWTKEVLSTGKYSLKITNPKKLKEVFKIFEKLTITEVRIVKATHSKLAFYKRKNRIAAIKAAKEKADYLLNAIKASTGKPLKVSEINHDLQSFAQVNYVNNSSKRYESSISKSSRGIAQFENIKLTSAIHVIFEIQ